MRPIGLLKPEEAARRAKENVAAFKADKERKAAEAKIAARRMPENKPIPFAEVKEGNGRENPFMKMEPLAEGIANKKLALKKEASNGLKLAIENGRWDEATGRIMAGENADGKIGDRSVMISAIRNKAPLRFIELLIRKGADVNSTWWLSKVKSEDTILGNGWTALHIALEEKRADVASLLLRNGANPSIPDPWSISSLDYYRTHRRVMVPELEALLQNNGKP